MNSHALSVNVGYNDNSVADLGNHRPAGPWRGGKYSVYEGGTRIPFITYYPGVIRPGTSDALLDHVDILRSVATLMHSTVPSNGGPDSLNELPAMLGKTSRGREYLVEEGLFLSIRTKRWKLVDRNQRPGTRIRPPWHPMSPEAEAKAKANEERFMPGEVDYPEALIELYDLADDPGETRNVASEYPKEVARLRAMLQRTRAQ